MIKSKSTLRRTRNAIVLILLGSLMYSCSVVECEECDNNVPEEIKKISSGDFAAYKSFMQKHPDPEFNCCIRNSGINSVNYNTITHVRSSKSLDIISDFFKYNLSQDIKDRFLNGYWNDSEDEEVTRFLIEQGAKLESRSYCDLSFLSGLKKIRKLGYDMNNINPETGRNLFLDYSAMGYENDKFKDGDCAVECLKYLNSVGVDTKIKDVDGKSALEIASDQTIINYLKSI